MNEDTAILEVMLELCEEENTELRGEIQYLQALVRYLEWENKQFKEENKSLTETYLNTIRLDKRLN